MILENGNWKIETRNSKTEIRKSRSCLPPFPRKKSALSLGERVTRDGDFTSRHGSGEGLHQPLTKRQMEVGKPRAGVADCLSLAGPHLATRRFRIVLRETSDFC
jgi:hypothetical protein